MKKTKLTLPLIGLLTFVTALTDAITGYVQSSYLNQFLALDNLGLFLAGVMIITILISFIYPRLVRRYSTYYLIIATYCLAVIASLFMAGQAHPWLSLIAFSVRYLSFLFIIINIDILLENVSDNESTGSIRTKHLTILNTAWLISPLLMSRIVGADDNYFRVYLIGGLVMLPIILLLILTREHLSDAVDNYQAQNLKEAIKQLLGNRDRCGIFLSSLALQFFYGLMNLYVPIHLHQTIGLSWATMSIIFTVMLLPFVLIQWPAGVIADRLLGEQEMLITGNLIMITSVIIIFFTQSTSPVVWGALLLVGRVGAALAESMQETYFYKKVDADEMAVINLYRQNRPLGWLIASVAAFITLNFFSLPAIFLVIAGGLTLGLIPAIMIKDTR